MPDGASQVSPDGAVSELRTKFVELEYRYLIESSFHSDNLRNQIIQFYLLVAGLAATAIVGLAQLAAKSGTESASRLDFPAWSYGALAFFVALVGVMMIPIFVRLRRVVMECLQGTVLLKRYVQQAMTAQRGEVFDAAMIWDADSLPTDEHYLTASFMLVLVVMLLDSAMFALSAASLRPTWLSWETWGMWSLTLGIFLLTVQVVVYRWLLYRELRRALTSDRLALKWAALGLMLEDDGGFTPPRILGPIVKAALVGGICVLLFSFIALALTAYDLLTLISRSLI